MRKSLACRLWHIIINCWFFLSNLIIGLKEAEPKYDNNTITSVYVVEVKNNSNKIKIERSGKLKLLIG